MRKLGRLSDKGRFVLFWGVGGLLELPLLALMAGIPLPVPLWLGLIAHLLSGAMVFFAPPKGKGYLTHTRHWGESLSLISLLLPGIGWVTAGGLVLGHWKSPADKHAYIFDDESPEEANPLAGMGSPSAIQRQVADAMDVIPAVDALLSQDSGLKRGAIETLSRIQTPEAVEWIRTARGDEDPEVRFYATTALTRLKHEFESAIHAAEKSIYSRPGDVAAHVSLQRVRYEYAVVGILEPEAQAALHEECRDRLGAVAGRSKDALRLLFLVERELDSDAAHKVLDRLEASIPEERERWEQDRAELYFKQGRIGDLRNLLQGCRKRLDSSAGYDPDKIAWRSSLLWWVDA